eukprot:822598-Rhodomonas_salina.1
MWRDFGGTGGKGSGYTAPAQVGVCPDDHAGAGSFRLLSLGELPGVCKKCVVVRASGCAKKCHSVVRDSAK